MPSLRGKVIRADGPRLVHIHYRRLPDRTEVHVQELVHESPEVKVTLARNLQIDAPLRVEGRVILETGSDAVWFTFPGAWHDIGRFHRADGTFTGIYANVLVPCVFEPGGIWRTTDLFLDLWLGAEPTSRGEAASEPVELEGEEAFREEAFRRPRVLDQAELDEAERKGWIERALADRARWEARELLRRWESGDWPPSIVGAWTRERARSRSRATTP
jgi:hypothetical protein